VQLLIIQIVGGFSESNESTCQGILCEESLSLLHVHGKRPQDKQKDLDIRRQNKKTKRAEAADPTKVKERALKTEASKKKMDKFCSTESTLALMLKEKCCSKHCLQVRSILYYSNLSSLIFSVMSAAQILQKIFGCSLIYLLAEVGFCQNCRLASITALEKPPYQESSNCGDVKRRCAPPA